MELALSQMALGAALRAAALREGEGRPTGGGGGGVALEEERRVLECFGTAKRIYEALGEAWQSAAASFQSGLFFRRIWRAPGGDARAAARRLRLGTNHLLDALRGFDAAEEAERLGTPLRARTRVSVRCELADLLREGAEAFDGGARDGAEGDAVGAGGEAKLRRPGAVWGAVARPGAPRAGAVLYSALENLVATRHLLAQLDAGKDGALQLMEDVKRKTAAVLLAILRVLREGAGGAPVAEATRRLKDAYKMVLEQPGGDGFREVLASCHRSLVA